MILASVGLAWIPLAVLLVLVLLLAVSRVMYWTRAQHRRDRTQAQMTRIDEVYARVDPRRSMKRQAKIEQRDGYL